MKAILCSVSVCVALACPVLQAKNITAAPAPLASKLKEVVSGGDVREFIQLLQVYPEITQTLDIRDNVHTLLELLKTHDRTEMIAHLYWHDRQARYGWNYFWYRPRENPIERAARNKDIQTTKTWTEALIWQLNPQKDEASERDLYRFLMPALNLALQQPENDISNYLLEKIKPNNNYITMAVQHNYLDLVKYALTEKYPIQTYVFEAEGQIYSLLYDAMYWGQVEIAGFLIEAGADVNWHKIKEKDHTISIMDLTLTQAKKMRGEGRAKFLEIAELLIANGYKLKYRDKRDLKKLGKKLVKPWPAREYKPIIGPPPMLEPDFLYSDQ